MQEAADQEDVPEEGADSGAEFDELRKRFLEGDPAEARDAFMGLVSMCEMEGEGQPSDGKKPALHILIGAGHP
jgi:hypothetical protein